MLFRAILLKLDHSIKMFWLETGSNWFDANNRSYFKDGDAVCQVMEEGNQIKDTVEAIYIEGNPLPLRSALDVADITVQHVEELISKESNRPAKNLLDILLRRK
jgi:hypothetical protein